MLPRDGGVGLKLRWQIKLGHECSEYGFLYGREEDRWVEYFDKIELKSYRKKSNKMQQCIKIFIIPYFKWSSICFGRHTAHHQEPKTAQAASVFAYVGGYRACSCWTYGATWQRPITARPITFHVCKTRGCLCSFRLLMMGGVSPETRWTPFKIRNNKKNWYTVASCWIFHCKNCTMMHGSTNIERWILLLWTIRNAYSWGHTGQQLQWGHLNIT
jgi:hypothetical protein